MEELRFAMRCYGSTKKPRLKRRCSQCIHHLGLSGGEPPGGGATTTMAAALEFFPSSPNCTVQTRALRHIPSNYTTQRERPLPRDSGGLDPPAVQYRYGDVTTGADDVTNRYGGDTMHRCNSDATPRYGDIMSGRYGGHDPNQVVVAAAERYLEVIQGVDRHEREDGRIERRRHDCAEPPPPLGVGGGGLRYHDVTGGPDGYRDVNGDRYRGEMTSEDCKDPNGGPRDHHLYHRTDITGYNSNNETTRSQQKNC